MIAQNPNLNVAAQGAISSHPVLTGSYNEPSFTPRFAPGLFHLRVEELDNGLLMHLAFREGEVSKRLFIKDLSEMTDVLTAQIAARKIGV